MHTYHTYTHTHTHTHTHMHTHTYTNTFMCSHVYKEAQCAKCHFAHKCFIPHQLQNLHTHTKTKHKTQSHILFDKSREREEGEGTLAERGEGGRCRVVAPECEHMDDGNDCCVATRKQDTGPQGRES